MWGDVSEEAVELAEAMWDPDLASPPRPRARHRISPSDRSALDVQQLDQVVLLRQQIAQASHKLHRLRQTNKYSSIMDDFISNSPVQPRLASQSRIPTLSMDPVANARQGKILGIAQADTLNQLKRFVRNQQKFYAHIAHEDQLLDNFLKDMEAHLKASITESGFLDQMSESDVQNCEMPELLERCLKQIEKLSKEKQRENDYPQLVAEFDNLDEFHELLKDLDSLSPFESNMFTKGDNQERN